MDLQRKFGTASRTSQSAMRSGKYSIWLKAAAMMGVASLALLPATSAVAAESPSASSTDIKVALSSDIDSLNPFLAVLSPGLRILKYQYEPLVEYAAEDNEIVPAIADSWTTSEDGKTWTFVLPADVKWSDGEAITSADVKWTFDAVMKQDALKMANGSLVENIVSVEAPDELTVVIKLKTAQAPNPGADLPIVPEHVWANLDDPSAYKNDKDTVGSGPFVVSNYDKTSGVQMVTNENYRHGAAKISGITYVTYKNGDASVQALKTGEVDLINGLTAAQYEALKTADNIKVNIGKGKSYTSLAINPGAKDRKGDDLGDGNPVLQDVVVRQAIQRAIDKNTIVNKVLQGLATNATGEIPELYPMYHWNASDTDLNLSFDPDAANKMLDEAGYSKNSDGIRLDKEGNPIKLRILGRSTDPTHQQMVDYIQPWLKAIGIDTTVTMESAAQVNDDSVLGKYDMYFTGWGMGPDPDFQLSINQCSSRPNADGTGATSESNWCSEEFDKLYVAQHTELDQEKRSALVIDAQKVVYEASANVVLYYGSTLEAYRSDRFNDFVTQPSVDGVILGQNGPWGLYSATPVAASEQSAAKNSGNPTWWIAGGVVVVAAVVIVVLRRRGSSADERE